MKKILPIIMIMVLVLTGIASADAPFLLTVALEDPESDFTTDVVVNAGDQIMINLGDDSVEIAIDGKTDDGLSFSSTGTLLLAGEETTFFTIEEGTTTTVTFPGNEDKTLSLSWVQLELDPLYEELVSKVGAVLNGEDVEAEDGEFSYIYQLAKGSTTMGFYVNDLDGDGVPELLIGENMPNANETTFYDVYTIADGELVHVFSGGERSTLYAAYNGGFLHHGSSSAFDSTTSFLYYANNQMNLMEAIIFTDNQWYISYTSETEVDENCEVIDQEEALAIISQYPVKYLQLDSFVE